MVLEYNIDIMRRIIILIIGLLLYSCHKSSPITDTTKIGKFNLDLVQINNQALIRIKSNTSQFEYELKLAPPCYFLRENGIIQTFSYPDVGVEKVILIIGDIANYEEKKKFGVDSGKVCGKKIQGLIMKNSNFALSEKTISGSLSCKDNGLDEKDFWDFAHN